MHRDTGKGKAGDQLTRRRFLSGMGTALAGAALASQLPGRLMAAPKIPSGLFTLGVASGDPWPDGFVLWTRLAPEPLNGGGMPPRSVAVQWRVALDEQMRTIVKHGVVQATPALGHSVHVEVHGLEPWHWYWYQFQVEDELSPIGRARTTPALGTNIDHLAFAFTSCQHWQQGLYTAHHHLSAEDLDLVVQLGDYIYEGGASANVVRPHNSPEIFTLSDYRNRYALYKSDPNLQAAHAAFPWIVTPDDHEVENNYAGALSENNDTPQLFLLRRAVAYQAYYEHQPLRRASRPMGPDIRLYRRLSFGNLAVFHVLDTRQYRTNQPCGDGTRPICEETLNPDATLMGPDQEQWLYEGLDASQARWNVIAQQVFMAQRDFTAGADATYSMDAWDGYPAARDRLMQFLAQRRPANPIVLTGDVHAHWVADLKANFADPNSATLGTEFIGTSISSGGDGVDLSASAATVLSESPHVKFYNGRRGYVRCLVTPEQWRTDLRVVPFVTTPGAPISTRASFIVTNGIPGAQGPL